MCINCADFVASCTEDGCHGSKTLPDGSRNLYAYSRKWYLDSSSPLCEHLQEMYGVKTVRELDMVIHPYQYDVEDRIEQWHISDTRLSLHEFLGMTWDEYKEFVIR